MVLTLCCYHPPRHESGSRDDVRAFVRPSEEEAEKDKRLEFRGTAGLLLSLYLLNDRLTIACP